MTCVPIAFGYCLTPQFFYALGVFVLAALAWNYYKSTPQPYFKGKVTVQLKHNYADFSESIIVTFHDPGRYQISFNHPHYRNAVMSAGLNQSRLVKIVPEQITVTEKWFPKPLIVVIEHEYQFESHKFG